MSRWDGYASAGRWDDSKALDVADDTALERRLMDLQPSSTGLAENTVLIGSGGGVSRQMD